jgi:hypothetical protein
MSSGEVEEGGHEPTGREAARGRAIMALPGRNFEEKIGGNNSCPRSLFIGDLVKLEVR